jgi:phosphoribosylformimino-5-aminoimidazole carboxamide ribotide isomerase
VRVIGAIDLRNGLAVRACAGHRDRYPPIGDPIDLARRYVEHYKLPELYVADLDAIESSNNGGGPDPPAPRVARPFQGRDQGDMIRRIADLGVPMWLDAAVSSVERARHALDLGASRVIVGLETLPSFHALRSICAAIDGGLVGFSLDLRAGEPIAGRGIPHEAPEQLVARAAAAGARSVIVLDLARVGTRAGVDFELLGRIRKAAPGLALLAGGGVRGPADLEKLAGLGCDGALVATALDALYPSVTR